MQGAIYKACSLVPIPLRLVRTLRHLDFHWRDTPTRTPPAPGAGHALLLRNPRTCLPEGATQIAERTPARPFGATFFESRACLPRETCISILPQRTRMRRQTGKSDAGTSTNKVSECGGVVRKSRLDFAALRTRASGFPRMKSIVCAGADIASTGFQKRKMSECGLWFWNWRLIQAHWRARRFPVLSDHIPPFGCEEEHLKAAYTLPCTLRRGLRLPFSEYFPNSSLHGRMHDAAGEQSP